MSRTKSLDKSKLNVTQIFLIFSTFVGDVEKTAAALNLDPKIVQQLSDEEGWQEHVKRICLLSKTGAPGSWERAQNRAHCFIQAHRLRGLLNAVMDNFNDMTPEEILTEIATVGKGGVQTLSARFFADVASAMEKCHTMSYAATGDTAGERSSDTDEDGKVNASALHMAVLDALNNPSMKRLPAEVLVQEVEASIGRENNEPQQ